jgi:hypothetical protein
MLLGARAVFVQRSDRAHGLSTTFFWSLIFLVERNIPFIIREELRKKEKL